MNARRSCAGSAPRTRDVQAPRPRLLVALCALVALATVALAAGCGDHGGEPIGFGDVTPTGGTLLFADVQPIDPFDPNTVGDTFDSSQVVCVARVFDFSVADGFRVWVSPSGQGGYQPGTDFIADPTGAYNTGARQYDLTLQNFDATLGADLVAHGARGGIENIATVISEHAFVPAAAPIHLARQELITLLRPINLAEVDTVPRLSWRPVAGAARYIVRIDGATGLQYLAVVPADTGHTVNSTPALFLQNVPLRPNLFFDWQVYAIDPYNRVIGRTAEPATFLARRRR